MLNSALRLLWRDATTLQLGVDPRHSVVLQGLTPQAESLLTLLDGTRDRAGVAAAAARMGISSTDVESMLDLLLSAGALDDASVSPPSVSRWEQARLAPELAELSLVGAPGSSRRVMTARGQATVLIAGCGRLGTLTAGLLAASGVGRLLLRDDVTGDESDVVPGVRPSADGRPRVVSAMAHVRASGTADVDAAVRLPSVEDCADADLVLVAADHHAVARHDVVDLLRAEHVPWLLAGVRETCGVVGPLTVPGRSACPRCLDFARAERDPAWPLLAAQLATAGRARSAGGAALTAAVAALATAQVLAHLAGPMPSLCVNATLEVRLPEWSVRRRGWSPHPRCGCVSTAGEPGCASGGAGALPAS
ncbi:MAG TPA: ThiF family adenylyltransferase [Mycobacteriales bacterium]|nr:ThiF family adenylyltransferase [Mycobacteriales bacterium]